MLIVKQREEDGELTPQTAEVRALTNPVCLALNF